MLCAQRDSQHACKIIEGQVDRAPHFDAKKQKYSHTLTDLLSICPLAVVARSRLNVLRSIDQTVLAAVTRIVAALSQLYIKASSPKLGVHVCESWQTKGYTEISNSEEGSACDAWRS